MKRSHVVVIGAGLAGTVLGNRLASDADVTLLELGEADRIRVPRVTFDRRPLAHVPTFCLGRGGTTNLWHNGLIPIHPHDVASPGFRDVLIDAQAFTDEAASQLFFNAPYRRAYDDAVAEMTALAEGAGLLGRGVDCLLYPKRFQPLAPLPSIRGVYSVSRLAFTFAGDRVTAVTFTAGNTEQTVAPSHLVVAAGAMGTPRVLRDILAASGQRCDDLGSGFIDHPIGFVGKVRFTATAAAAVRRLSAVDKGDYVVRSALRLRSTDGTYTCCAFLRPALTLENDLAIYKYKSSLGATRGLARLRHACSPKLLHPDVIAEICGHVFGVHPSRRTYNILLIAEQRRGRSRVYYDGDDLHVDWSISPEEIAAYQDVLGQLRELLLPVADAVNIEPALTEDWLWSGAHHSGTTSLGVDGLVDRDLRLRGCRNVFVCDGSVIQEHSYANTGLTIAQLALRLARDLSSAPAA